MQLEEFNCNILHIETIGIWMSEYRGMMQDLLCYAEVPEMPPANLPFMDLVRVAPEAGKEYNII